MDKKSQLQFAHRCALLLESGISLPEALLIIMRMESSKKRLALLASLHRGVERGVSLSKSMASSNSKFDSLLSSMISHGESSGILALSLRQAAEILEKGSEVKKKIISALIYPAFIALATGTMTTFLVMYIFPKIMPLFSSMSIQLPLITRIVRKLYELAFAYGLHAVTAVVVLSILFYYIYFQKKHSVFRHRVQMTILTFPILGQMFQKYFMSMSCRSAATLLGSGQSLPVVVEQLAHSSTLDVYHKAWKFVRSEVERGIPLSASLRSVSSIFPSVVPDVLAIGERTGELRSMFHHVSRMYEQELEDIIKHVSSSIEPILMIAMGLIVGSVALSIILPIYEITNHLNR